MSANLTRLSDAMKAIKKELKDKGTALVEESFADFFLKHPDVLEVRWTQYTPGWNDGDVCEFGVNDFYGIIQADLDSVVSAECSDEDLYCGGHDGGPLSKAAEKDLYAIQRLLDTDDFLQTMLGDPLKVKVTRSGVETEYYDCY